MLQVRNLNIQLSNLASMIFIRLGRVDLQEANKGWRESALRPNVQVCAAYPQLVRYLLLAGLAGCFRHSIQVARLSNLY